tara:strand:- start:9847 stop:10008 length:162 start_codon:yes stop_codon:yes gene_type:complete
MEVVFVGVEGREKTTMIRKMLTMLLKVSEQKGVKNAMFLDQSGPNKVLLDANI